MNSGEFEFSISEIIFGKDGITGVNLAATSKVRGVAPRNLKPPVSVYIPIKRFAAISGVIFMFQDENRSKSI